MAIHAHSTPAPAIQPRGLLRSGGAPCRVLSHGEMLALLGERPELPAEPLLGADLPQGVASSVLATVAETSVALARHRGASAPDLAHTLHARRELRNALEYGFALLDALGLPSLALDVIDDGIAALDRMDALDEDLEDDAAEADTADAEPSLGALDARLDQTSWAGGCDDDREHEDEDDRTAPERFGKGFVRCALDDNEDDELEGPDDNGIADIDGQAEQWPGSVVALPFSVGGYVA